MTAVFNKYLAWSNKTLVRNRHHDHYHQFIR